MKATSRHWTRSWPVILLGVFAFIANPYRSVAAPCDGVPDCEPQVMDIVQYSELQTKGWAYYCGGDHPYYWNNDPILGFGNNFSADNSCFKITENPFVEDVNKMDATITNWCNAIEVVAVTLGCSRQPQAGLSCPTTLRLPMIPTVRCKVRSESLLQRGRARLFSNLDGAMQHRSGVLHG